MGIGEEEAQEAIEKGGGQEAKKPDNSMDNPNIGEVSETSLTPHCLLTGGDWNISLDWVNMPTESQFQMPDLYIHEPEHKHEPETQILHPDLLSLIDQSSSENIYSASATLNIGGESQTPVLNIFAEQGIHEPKHTHEPETQILHPDLHPDLLSLLDQSSSETMDSASATLNIVNTGGESQTPVLNIVAEQGIHEPKHTHEPETQILHPDLHSDLLSLLDQSSSETIDSASATLNIGGESETPVLNIVPDPDMSKGKKNKKKRNKKAAKKLENLDNRNVCGELNADEKGDDLLSGDHEIIDSASAAVNIPAKSDEPEHTHESETQILHPDLLSLLDQSSSETSASATLNIGGESETPVLNIVPDPDMTKGKKNKKKRNKKAAKKPENLDNRKGCGDLNADAKGDDLPSGDHETIDSPSAAVNIPAKSAPNISPDSDYLANMTTDSQFQMPDLHIHEPEAQIQNPYILPLLDESSSETIDSASATLNIGGVSQTPVLNIVPEPDMTQGKKKKKKRNKKAVKKLENLDNRKGCGELNADAKGDDLPSGDHENIDSPSAAVNIPAKSDTMSGDDLKKVVTSYSLRLEQPYVVKIEGVEQHSELDDLHTHLQVTFHNFPFSEMEKIVCKGSYKEEHYGWFLCNYEHAFYSCTLLFTHDFATPSLKPLPGSRYFLPPLGHYQFVDNERRVHCAISYPRFTVFAQYVNELVAVEEKKMSGMTDEKSIYDAKENSRKVIEEELCGFVREFVEGVLDFHKGDLHHGKISPCTIVVYGKRPYFICNPLESKKYKGCAEELKDLGKSLRAAFPKKDGHVEIGEDGHECCYIIGQCSKRMTDLVRLLEGVKTLEECKWMCYAPLILSDFMNVNLSIQRFQDLACNNADVKRVLKSQEVKNWEQFVRLNGRREMISCLDHHLSFSEPISESSSSSAPVTRSSGSSGLNSQSSDSSKPPCWFDDKYSLLRFLRNCTCHLNERKLKTYYGRRHSDYSALLLKPSLFIKFVDQISEGLLNNIFNFMAKNIPCLLEDKDAYSLDSHLPLPSSPQLSLPVGPTCPHIRFASDDKDSVHKHKLLLYVLETQDVPIKLPVDIFGLPDESVIVINRELGQIWFEQEQLESSHMCLYMRFLWDMHWSDMFQFLSPDFISQNHAPMEERVKYIASVIVNKPNRNVLLAPYHFSNHWVLLVLLPHTCKAYWIDSLCGNIEPDAKELVKRSYARAFPSAKRSPQWTKLMGPCQTNGIDCGYFVLRTMRGIYQRRTADLSDVILENRYEGKETYTQEDLDGIRLDGIRYLEDILFPNKI